MADLNKVIEHVSRALEELRKAEAAMTPIDSIKQIEAYSLGFLKSSIVQSEHCRDALTQAAEFRGKNKTKAGTEPPDTLKGS